MGNQVAAHGHEFCIGLPGLHGLQAGVKQNVRRVDSARVAALLKRGKRLLLIRRRRGRKDRPPLGHRGSDKLLRLGGIVKGVEVDIADKKRGDGAGSLPVRNVRSEPVQPQQAELPARMQRERAIIPSTSRPLQRASESASETRYS